MRHTSSCSRDKALLSCSGASSMSVNLEGQWLGMRACMPSLLAAGPARGASSVSGCFISGNAGSSGAAAYQASRGRTNLSNRMITRRAEENPDRGARCHASAMRSSAHGKTYNRETTR